MESKKKWLTILILIITVILGIIAVVTAIKLYQMGKKPVAPTAPKQAPAYTECSQKASITARDIGSGETEITVSAQIAYTNVAIKVESLNGEIYLTDPLSVAQTEDGWQWIWETATPLDEIQKIIFLIDYPNDPIECGSWPEEYPSCYKACVSDNDFDPGLFFGMEWCLPGQQCIQTPLCYNPGCPADDSCSCPIPTPVTECALEFEIEGPTATPTPTPTSTVTPTPTVIPSLTPTPTPTNSPTPTPTPTPKSTPTPLPGCWDTCDNDNDCSGSLVCQTINGTDRCLNASCPEQTDCVCPGPTATPTSTPTPGGPTATPTSTPVPLPPGATATPTPIPELPEAGLSLPTLGAVGLGLLLIIGSLLLTF